MTYEDFEREVKEIISEYIEADLNMTGRELFWGIKYTALEEKSLYQDFREKAVELFPNEDWEWVHREYDKIFKEFVGA